MILQEQKIIMIMKIIIIDDDMKLPSNYLQLLSITDNQYKIKITYLDINKFIQFKTWWTHVFSAFCLFFVCFQYVLSEFNTNFKQILDRSSMTVICGGNDKCHLSKIYCPNTECNIICNEYNSCFGSDIYP